jgi:hypothetical protein
MVRHGGDCTAVAARAAACCDRPSPPGNKPSPVDVAPCTVLSPLPAMRCLAPALALLLAAPTAGAQLVPFTFVSRAGSPRAATTLDARVNRADCAAGEVITVRASLPAATAGVPELWVSETTACDPSVREPGLGASCFAICSEGVRRACTIPYAEGEREYTFTVPVRWIIDPRLGLCSAVAGRRYLQLVVGDTVVARSSPSIRRGRRGGRRGGPERRPGGRDARALLRAVQPGAGHRGHDRS